MSVKHATSADLDQITKIETASFPAAEASSKEMIAKRLHYFADHYWLAENDQHQICAFVSGLVTNKRDLNDAMYAHPEMHNPNGRWQMILSVATDPEHRGQGYAAQAMRQMIHDVKNEHRRGIVLTCKDRLIPFYEQFGFHNEGVSQSTHGGETWYQMRLTFEKE